MQLSYAGLEQLMIVLIANSPRVGYVSERILKIGQ